MIMRRSFSILTLAGLAVGGTLLLAGTANAGKKAKTLPKGDEFEGLAVKPSQVDPMQLMVEFADNISELGGPANLRNFSQVVTDTETGGSGNYLVGLGNEDWFPSWSLPNLNAPQSRRDTESSAARKGFANNPLSLQSSPYNKQNWSFGSGGWFGFLPSTALGWLKSNKSAWGKPQYSPFDVFDPWRSTVALADFVYRVQGLGQWKALPAKERNWTAVKRTMRSLAALSDYRGEGPGAVINASMPGRLLKYGIDPAFGKVLVPKRPDNWSPMETWNLVNRLVPSAYLLPNGGMGSDKNS